VEAVGNGFYVRSEEGRLNRQSRGNPRWGKDPMVSRSVLAHDANVKGSPNSVDGQAKRSCVTAGGRFVTATQASQIRMPAADESDGTLVPGWKRARDITMDAACPWLIPFGATPLATSPCELPPPINVLHGELGPAGPWPCMP